MFWDALLINLVCIYFVVHFHDFADAYLLLYVQNVLLAVSKGLRI